MPIIDCHTHLNNYHADTAVPATEQRRRLADEMRRHKIDHALVLTSYTVDVNRPSAQQVLEEIWGDPKMHVVEGVPVTEETMLDYEAIEQRLKDDHTHGLKLYPGYLPFYPQDKICDPVYELAARYGVPVMIHTGDTLAKKAKLKHAHPLNVDEVAVDWPDVTFVMCHLGNPWTRDAAEVLYKNENVYADISGLFLETEHTSKLQKYMVGLVRETITFMGEGDKLLYGTDWPLVPMKPYLGFVKSLRLSSKEKELIMWKNAARIFGLEMDGGHQYGPRESVDSADPRASP